MMGWVLLLWEGVVAKGQASKPSEVRIFQQIRIQSGHKKSHLELTSQTFHRAIIDSGLYAITHLGFRFSVVRQATLVTARVVYHFCLIKSSIFLNFFIKIYNQNLISILIYSVSIQSFYWSERNFFERIGQNGHFWQNLQSSERF